MAYRTIIYEKRGSVARITLNRPKKMNALSLALFKELNAAFADAANDAAIRAIVLTGKGKAYSAGVDLNEVKDTSLRDERTKLARQLIKMIETAPKVVIAMVNGFCLTGGLEISLSCDLIIASEDAVFGDTHVRWGLPPLWGMSYKLPRAVGMLKAKELSFTTGFIPAKEAERIGLINAAVPRDKLEATVRQTIDQILANDQGAIATYKHLYNSVHKDNMDKALKRELDLDVNREGKWDEWKA